MPTITLVDTMQAAANHLSFGRLVDVCAHYGIEMGRHHDALCDAIACKDVFYKLAAEGAVLDPIEWAPGTKSTHGTACSSKLIDGLGFTNGTHQPIEEILEEFDSMGLKWGPDDVDSLENLRIVVTGLVPGYPGDAIELELKSQGAKTAKSVSGKTQVIAIGHNAGMSKINPAKEREIPIMAVADSLEVLDR